MNINGIVSNKVSAFTKTGKIGTGNNQNVVNKDDNKKNDLSSLAIVQNKGKKNENSIVAMLIERKESMQKNIEGLQKRLSNIGALKEKLPYEEVKVMENGKEVTKKVYSDEDLKSLKRLEVQEATLAEKIKGLTEKMDGLDGDISAAMVAEQARKADQEKEEREKAIEKAAEKKAETKDDQERKEQLKQSEFLIQSDSVKKYVQSGRALKARLEQELTRKENEMATDAMNSATAEQSALHHKHPKYESPVADTSFIGEQTRIRDGQLTRSERRYNGGKLDDLRAALIRTEESINSGMGKINRDADELRNEKREPVNKAEDDNESPQETIQSNVE